VVPKAKLDENLGVFHRAAEEEGIAVGAPTADDQSDSIRKLEGPSDEVTARELRPSAPANGENLHPDEGVKMEGPFGESRVADLLPPQ
jgi:hypothetical protein